MGPPPAPQAYQSSTGLASVCPISTAYGGNASSTTNANLFESGSPSKPGEGSPSSVKHSSNTRQEQVWGYLSLSENNPTNSGQIPPGGHSPSIGNNILSLGQQKAGGFTSPFGKNPSHNGIQEPLTRHPLQHQNNYSNVRGQELPERSPSYPGNHSFHQSQQHVGGFTCPPGNNPSHKGIQEPLTRYPSQTKNNPSNVSGQKLSGGFPPFPGNNEFYRGQQEAGAFTCPPGNNTPHNGIQEPSTRHPPQTKNSPTNVSGQKLPGASPSCPGNNAFYQGQQQAGGIACPPLNNPSHNGIQEPLARYPPQTNNNPSNVSGQKLPGGSPSSPGNNAFYRGQPPAGGFICPPLNNPSHNGIQEPLTRYPPQTKNSPSNVNGQKLNGGSPSFPGNNAFYRGQQQAGGFACPPLNNPSHNGIKEPLTRYPPQNPPQTRNNPSNVSGLKLPGGAPSSLSSFDSFHRGQQQFGRCPSSPPTNNLYPHGGQPQYGVSFHYYPNPTQHNPSLNWGQQQLGGCPPFPVKSGFPYRGQHQPEGSPCPPGNSSFYNGGQPQSEGYHSLAGNHPLLHGGQSSPYQFPHQPPGPHVASQGDLVQYEPHNASTSARDYRGNDNANGKAYWGYSNDTANPFSLSFVSKPPSKTSKIHKVMNHQDSPAVVKNSPTVFSSTTSSDVNPDIEKALQDLANIRENIDRISTQYKDELERLSTKYDSEYAKLLDGVDKHVHFNSDPDLVSPSKSRMPQIIDHQESPALTRSCPKNVCSERFSHLPTTDSKKALQDLERNRLNIDSVAQDRTERPTAYYDRETENHSQTCSDPGSPSSTRLKLPQEVNRQGSPVLTKSSQTKFSGTSPSDATPDIGKTLEDLKKIRKNIDEVTAKQKKELERLFAQQKDALERLATSHDREYAKFLERVEKSKI